MTRENEIIRLYNEGLSGNQIACQIGLGKTRVYEILKQYNANMDSHRYTRGIHSSGKKALSPEDTMSFVKKLIAQSEYKKVSTDNVSREFPFEYYCITHHYKSITNAIKLSGEYVLDKGVPKRWSKDFLLSQIRLGYALGMPLNSEHVVRGYGCSANYYARETFGSWENAIKAAGINYEDIKQDASTLAPLGHEFESVLSEILTELNVSFKQYDHDKYRPDFVVDNEWIDAKLSQDTFKTKDNNGLTCIDKYEPYCDKLTIVFLRGDKDCDINVTNKTRLVNVYKYVNKLPEVLRNKYSTKLDELERRAGAV